MHSCVQLTPRLIFDFRYAQTDFQWRQQLNDQILTAAGYRLVLWKFHRFLNLLGVKRIIINTNKIEQSSLKTALDTARMDGS